MGTVIYKPLIDEMRWSFSRVNAFENCPYEWYLRYLYGLEPETSFYASYGSFIHKIIERFYRGEIQSEEMVAEFLSGFSENVVGKRPSEKIVASYIEKGIKYFEAFRPFPFECVAVEDRIEFGIGQRNFIAFVDYIGLDERGDYVIIDHKSRDLKQLSGRSLKKTLKDAELLHYLQQLYLYAEAVRQKYGKLPTKLCFNCFKSGVFITNSFDPERFEQVKRDILKEIEYISEQEEFPPRLDWFYCNNLCGFPNDCEYKDMMWGGKH